MAERTVIDRDHSIELPHGCDPVVIAEAMNPAMAAWLALCCRAEGFSRRPPFQRGKRVLILGATGSSGRLAVQIARHVGVTQVIAAGRDEARLADLHALGATRMITVLDFLWGDIAPGCLELILAQLDICRLPLTWIHVGSMAGEAASLPGAFLRRADLHIIGSGNGSDPGRAIGRELPTLARAITHRSFRVNGQVAPLRKIGRFWMQPADGGSRIVFIP